MMMNVYIWEHVSIIIMQVNITECREHYSMRIAADVYAWYGKKVNKKQECTTTVIARVDFYASPNLLCDEGYEYSSERDAALAVCSKAAFFCSR